MKIFKAFSNLVLLILIGILIYVIWLKQDELISLAYNVLRFERKVDIKESNDYKRYYNYVEYTIEEDYEPQDMDDLKNIIFNYLNNGWDEFTFYCPREYVTCLDDVKTISNDSTILSTINNYINPFNTFNNIYTKISSDGTITLTLERTYTEEMKEEVNNKIDEIIKELNLNGLSTKKQIRLIHDYLIDHIEYDKNEEIEKNSSSNAYGALINNIAICSGYADSMALFLDRLDIPNLKISSETHVWNLVFVGGKWLHLDATWDDPINAITDSNKHVYFLITNKKLKELDSETHNYIIDDYKETLIGG